MIVSLGVNKKRILAVLVLIAIAVSAFFLIPRGEKRQTFPGMTGEERLAFLTSFGWEAEAEPQDVREVVTEFLRMLHLRRTPRGLKPNRRERRLISFLILATLPLIPAAFLSNVVESLYQNTVFIGVAVVMTGFLLFAADRMGHGNKDERSSTSADAIVVGLAQAVAVVPGLSRSGTTISAGMLRGFERSFAVKFSFLLSIPAVVGANLVSIIKVFSTGVEWSYVPMYLVGVACAFVSGYFAIYFLRLIVQRGKFGGFCYYCWGAGLVTLLLSLIS